MIPEERFRRWTAVGVPLLLLIGIAGSIVIHMGYKVPWSHLFVPASLYVGLQISFYMGAFFVRKWSRQHELYWPMSLLGGLYLWGTGLIIIYYGTKWGILPNSGDFFSFSAFIGLVMVITLFIVVKFRDKLSSAIRQLNK